MTADDVERTPGPEDVLEQAAAWRRAGRDVAIATVVSTWGSAAFRSLSVCRRRSSTSALGCQLAVDADGAMVGSVSGGCVEGAVVAEARDVMADGEPRLLEFGVSNDEAWEVGLACGGTIQVFVERVD